MIITKWRFQIRLSSEQHTFYLGQDTKTPKSTCLLNTDWIKWNNGHMSRDLLRKREQASDGQAFYLGYNTKTPKSTCLLNTDWIEWNNGNNMNF